MRKYSNHLTIAGPGVLALGAAVASRYLTDQHASNRVKQTTAGSQVSERQMLERRRARAAEVAAAGTTTL